ncbi:MAG: lysylphosphatidylglycerol synthase transmembrane domain-containing protein [Acidimicrobiales bacterium]
MSIGVREVPGATGDSLRPRGRGRWRWVRRAVALAVLAGAVYAAYGRRGELAAAASQLGHASWEWLAAATACQLAALVLFAGLQWWLLRCGEVEVSAWSMVEIAFAGNALGTSLPGGPAWSATWVFSQLRRRGADRVLAGWVVLAASALSGLALFALAVAGAFVAGSAGPVAGLRPLAIALAALVVLAAVGLRVAMRSPGARARSRSSAAAVLRHVPLLERSLGPAERLVDRISVVRPSPLGWLEAFMLAAGNWAGDAATLSLSVLALRVHIDWRGLLVVYAITQLSASLPITPGGLGVVEGSLVALLSAYGMSVRDALAVTFLYRLISFWGVVPVGWVAWLGLEAAARGGWRHAPHPWAPHRHGPEPAPRQLDRRGPERVLPTSQCDGCEEPAEGPPVSGGRWP